VVAFIGHYFDFDPDRVFRMWQVTIDKGLSADEVVARRELYGSNILPPAKPRPLWRIVWDQFTDFIVMVLILAAIVSFAIG